MRKFEVYKNNSRAVVFVTESTEGACYNDVYQLESGERLQVTDEFYLEVELEKSPTDISDWLTSVVTFYVLDSGEILIDDSDVLEECTTIGVDGDCEYEYYSQFSRSTVRIFPRPAEEEVEPSEVEPAKEEL